MTRDKKGQWARGRGHEAPRKGSGEDASGKAVCTVSYSMGKGDRQGAAGKGQQERGSAHQLPKMH